jgi:hypothetical protein
MSGETKELKEVHAETLACCGGKKCVKARLFEDGSVELFDDDPEAGSVGTIKMRPEAAARLVELLSKRSSG